MILKNKKAALCILLAVCTVIGSLVAFGLTASAADAEGMSFSSTDFYQMSKSVPTFSSWTFETEFWMPANFSGRGYNFIGNWATDSKNRSGNEWGIELHNNGSIRLFSAKSGGGSIYFGSNSTSNKGKPTDYRIYMTDENGNPTYVKMAITVDTTLGNAYLYMNGELVGSILDNSFFKDLTYTPSAKNPYHRIGFDHRDDTNCYFKGKIKNMAMYSYAKTEAEVAAAASSSFAPLVSDSRLMFAYDLTVGKLGYIEDLSANNNDLNFVNWYTEEGRSFAATDELFITKTLTAMPRTYEAWIYAPLTSNRTGLIMGNYGSGNSELLNFEIYSSGRPSIYIKDKDGNLMDTKFNYDIRRSGWAHLIITHETLATGGSRFSCYVNGELVDSFDKELSYEFAPANITSLSLGGDSRSNNEQYYKGRIREVAMYSDLFTPEEIMQSYKNGVDENNTSLLCHYELNGTEGAKQVFDSSDNGVDLRPIFFGSPDPLKLGEDYAYSMAIIGDTQKLVYYDAYNGTNYTSYIYDWLVQNKDKKNIQFVMGLGDITDKNGKDQTPDDGIDQTDVEWDIIVKELHKLEAAGLAYSLVQGNHENVAQLDKFFASNPNFTNADIGYYSGTSLGNYYIRYTAGGNKYMVIVFEYGPNDAMLKWAGQQIAANPDRQVIITTHAYMFRDGTTLDMTDVVPPRPGTEKTEPTADAYDNNGDQIWTKLASQYENVFMVLGGHDPCANLVWRTDVGVHGNTVFQMLVDPQGMDPAYSYKTGMIAMLYFSADGKQIKAEYVSSYRTLEAQKLDASASDVLYNQTVNSFTYNVPELKASESVEVTILGNGGYVVPGAYSNEVTYPFVVFKTDKTFVGAYGDLGAATAAAKNKSKSGDYYVLMRRDAEQNTKSAGLLDMTGSITVDLGGHTLYKTAVGYIFDLYVNDNSTGATNADGYNVRGTYSMCNGTIESYDASHPIACVNYGEKLAKNVLVTIAFDGITFVDKAGGYHIVATWENGYGKTTSGAVVHTDLIFNDCTFDYKNSTDGARMLELTNAGKDICVFDVYINGGKIISDNVILSGTFATADTNANGRADMITFGKGSDGEYIKMMLPSTITLETVGNVWCDAKGNEYHFAYNKTEGFYSVYDFVSGGDIEVVLPNKTPYGEIPDAYIDASVYPILLFGKDGSFIGGYNVFSTGQNSEGVMSKVKELLDGNVDGEKGNTLYVYFRGNATLTGGYSNVGQILGNVVFDLNGYTLTQTFIGNSFFNSQAKNWKGMDDASFTFINGKIEMKSNLLYFGAYGDLYKTGAGMKTFHITFTDITFTYTGTSGSNFLGKYADDSTTAGKSVGYDLEFNNCVFDLRNSPITTLFNANDTKTGESDTNCIINIVVNGGKIIADSAEIIWYEVGENGSSVAFEKDTKGNLVSLVLTTDAEKVTNGIHTTLGELGFVKSSKCDEGYVYTTVAKALADLTFTPKVSITLDRDLILNVYIPVTDALTALKFRGTGVDLKTLEVAELDGTDHYVIRTPMAASLAAGSISVEATLTAGGSSASKSYTFGIIRYAELVLAENNEIEKQLVRDVLSYVRAAYAYFGTQDAEAIAKIDFILGIDYDKNNAHTEEGSTEVVTPGFKGATLALDATPAIRFYLDGNTDATAYTFYVNGARVPTVTGTDTNGAYIEIDVYAYAMCGTVTYTVNGETGGSYHIASYYKYASESGDAKLISLVDRMWKYFQSAREYRNSVIGA